MKIELIPVIELGYNNQGIETPENILIGKIKIFGLSTEINLSKKQDLKTNLNRT